MIPDNFYQGFESRLSKLEERVDNMISDLTEIRRDVHKISDVIVSSRGGMRVIAGLFGVAIALGGFIASWSSWWHKP